MTTMTRLTIRLCFIFFIMLLFGLNVTMAGNANDFFNTGNKLYHKGDYDRAASYFHKALSLSITNHKNDNLNIAIIYNALGLAYDRRGNRNKAIKYYVDALKHMDVAIKQLAEKNSNKKKRLFKLAFTKKRPNNQNSNNSIQLKLANIYNNKGIAHWHKAEYRKAIGLLKNAIDIKRNVLGFSDPSLASSYANLGLVYEKRRDHTNAILYNNKALIIQLKTLGPQHTQVGRSYINLGTAYLHRRQYNKAINYYTKGIPILRKTLGENHPDIATSYSNLGVAYNRKGTRKKAVIFHKKALSIRLEKLRPMHPDTALSYKYLGVAYKNSGNTKAARRSFKNGLEISKKGLGTKHAYTRFFQRQLSKPVKTKIRSNRTRKSRTRKTSKK